MTPAELANAANVEREDVEALEAGDSLRPVTSCSRSAPDSVSRILPREPQRFRGFSPVFAGARGSLTNRGAEIRTRDLTDPNGARYQAAPRPDVRGKYHTPARALS